MTHQVPNPLDPSGYSTIGLEDKYYYLWEELSPRDQKTFLSIGGTNRQFYYDQYVSTHGGAQALWDRWRSKDTEHNTFYPTKPIGYGPLLPINPRAGGLLPVKPVDPSFKPVQPVEPPFLPVSPLDGDLPSWLFVALIASGLAVIGLVVYLVW